MTGPGRVLAAAYPEVSFWRVVNYADACISARPVFPSKAVLFRRIEGSLGERDGRLDMVFLPLHQI